LHYYSLIGCAGCLICIIHILGWQHKWLSLLSTFHYLPKLYERATKDLIKPWHWPCTLIVSAWLIELIIAYSSRGLKCILLGHPNTQIQVQHVNIVLILVNTTKSVCRIIQNTLLSNVHGIVLLINFTGWPNFWLTKGSQLSSILTLQREVKLIL
jgi:hypothetical protein